MKLSVKNLGPITKGGTIDLDKRFYVFVGKNGSGKTYLANLLYGFFGKYYKSFLNTTHDNYLLLPHFTQETKFISIKKEDLPHFSESFSIKDVINFILPNPVITNKTKLLATLSYEKDFFSKKINISILVSHNNLNKEIKTAYSFVKESNSNVIYLKEEKNQSFFKNTAFSGELNNGQKEISYDNISQIFWYSIFPNWLANQTHNICLLPAERAYFLSYWKYISRVERHEKELLYRIATNPVSNTHNDLNNLMSLYTESVQNLIDRLEHFDTSTIIKTNSSHFPLVQELETLMGGTINLKEGKEGIGRKRFVFEMQENGDEIELFLASSSVNQLSLLYIYLKYWAAEENNFLIIDEPEISLHPENQVKLLNILMKFADMNNNRVLITTHSTLMADAVNNHVRIGQLQTTENGKNWLNEHKSWLKENQLDINENITHEDFGVYYFDGAIKNYEVKDYGVFFKDFANAEDKIKDAADILKGEIYNELHPKKAQ